MMAKSNLSVRGRSATTIDTTIFQPFIPCSQVTERIMHAFHVTSITNLYNFSDVQLLALNYAFNTILKSIYQPLIDELDFKHGYPANKRGVGLLDVDVNSKPAKFSLFNTFSTYGSDTSLELQIKIKLVYDLYVEYLCKHFDVPNDKVGRSSIKIHLNKPNKSQMYLLLPLLLSQSDLLVTSQRSSSQKVNSLLFSINTTFFVKDVS
jgi:hypothetical protein